MRHAAIALLTLASCASAAEQPTSEQAPDSNMQTAPAATPTGARVEPSGYATILSAPPEPYPHAPPPAPAEAQTQRLARTSGISVSEAESRMNPDSATRHAAMDLRRRLERGARGNYVDVKVIRDPKPRFVFYFRREAAATLARYTSDKRFQAVEGGIPEEELRPLFESWMQRLQRHRLVSGGSINAFDGQVELEIGVSRREFEEIAAREAWRVPPQVKLGFAGEIDPSTVVAADVAPFIRSFARADRAPGATLDIAIHGRIVLRDGCFLLEGGNGASPLVLFGRDTRLHRDAEGYLTVSSLRNPDNRARIGEDVVMTGYPAAMEEEPGVRALRAACGPGPISAVGEPISASRFRVRPWAIASYAQARRISRQQAWDEIKACWRDQDTQRQRMRRGETPPPPMRDCDSVLPINPPPPARPGRP